MKHVGRVEVGIEVEFGGGWRIFGSCEAVSEFLFLHCFFRM